MHLPASWRSLFSGRSLEKLQLEVLPRSLSSQRWFSGKAEKLASTRVLDWGEIADMVLEGYRLSAPKKSLAKLALP